MTKASVLIVEDSFIVAFHLQKTLEKEGYRVIGTEPSGESALQLLEHKKADVVLMDIMLSGKMDGIEAARFIKSRFNLPVIYITALTDKETIQRAKVTEPYGYLTKPFEDREVFTVIEMAVYKHSIEMKLRQSEEKFFSTVRSISDGVIVTDEQFNVTYMNPSAEKLSGRMFSQVHPILIFDVLKLRNPETGEQFVNPLQNAVSRTPSNTFPGPLILISPDGSERPIEGTVSPLVDSKGKIAGAVLVFNDISQRVEHEQLLKNMEKIHLSALLEGQEKERSRIAKDLHDGLGQMLNALKLRVNLLAKDSQSVDGLYELIDEAIQESVRISENLLPAKLKDFDLASCVRSLCNSLSSLSGVSIAFEAFGGPSRVEQPQKINLYRIVQEALSNALKHAQASMINVQLNEDHDKVQLTIEDDGKGFDLNKPYDHGAHHGLINMQERASLMGGSCTIESDAERGTLVMIETPLNLNTPPYVKI